MERDPHISRMMKEGGVQEAPEGFTASVMANLPGKAVKPAYKPLISRKGLILIALLVLGIVALTIVMGTADPASGSKATGLLEGYSFSLPEWKLQLDFMSRINPSAGVAAALVALFILVLSDARFSRRGRLV